MSKPAPGNPPPRATVAGRPDVGGSVSAPGPGTAAGAPEKRWFWTIVAGCLLVQLLLAADCARQWTPTHDEYWHLPIGLRMWKSGRFDDDVINPPPVRLWAALPLFLGGASPGDVDSRLDVGAIGDAFWNANGDRVRFWFLLGRLMIIPLATITGLAVVLWSRSWYGDRAALLSLALWTCCPTVLANASIVTHDLPLAAVWTLALLALVRFAEGPSWPRSLGFGLLLGLAPLAKLTGLLLLPLSLVLWFVLRVGRRPSEPLPDADSSRAKTAAQSSLHIAGMWAVALLTSLAVINACYLFRGTGSALGSLKVNSSQLLAIQKSAASVPVPLPTDFVAALDRLAQDLERRHPVYLDGEWSDRPFARYYAAALAYKLPISALILILIGFIGLFRPRPASLDRRHAIFLLIAALILPIIASGSSNQIGIRYVLPTFPLLFVFAGQTARCLDIKKPASSAQMWGVRFAWVALLAAPLALRFHPHHLAYFNVLAGGPAEGRWHLVDSNIDWGQDLHALKGYLDQQQLTDVGLAYFGTVIPAKVGITSHRPPSRFPQPGWHAISVNFVQGRPHAIRDDNGDRTQVGIEEFGYFRFFEPVAKIGYSIYVYRITQQDVARYAAALQQMQRDSR